MKDNRGRNNAELDNRGEILNGGDTLDRDNSGNVNRGGK